MFVFENEQFSGYFFFWRKKVFYPINKNFCVFEKNAFLGIFFQNFQNFSAHKKFVKIFVKFFDKKYPKKNIFFQKKENVFSKRQSSFLSG